ncbi:MAG: hypothetical protein C4584_02275 [Armatimonadetes bacterium]|nr:MAG: hypothetical protein C4584_02275 [Armatimonadota bacterium]
MAQTETLQAGNIENLTAELFVFDKEIVLLTEEVAGRHLSGVSSPKLEVELNRLIYHRDRVVEKVSLVQKSITGQGSRLSIAEQIDKTLEEYSRVSGKEVKYVRREKRTKKEARRQQKARDRLDEVITAAIRTKGLSSELIFGQEVVSEDAPKRKEKRKTKKRHEKVVPRQDSAKPSESHRTDVLDEKNGEEIFPVVTFEPNGDSDVADKGRNGLTARVEPVVLQRDTPDRFAIQYLVMELDRSRYEYIVARKKARSFWKNLAGNMTSLWGYQGLTPDQTVAIKRDIYEALKNRHIATISVSEINKLEQEVDSDQTALRRYREKVVRRVTEKIAQETGIFIEVESRASQQNILESLNNRFYRHTWWRSGIGFGLSFGVGVSAALGLVPVSMGLVGLRGVFTAVGYEGLIHGACDFYSENFGRRKNLFDDRSFNLSAPEVEMRLSSFYEDDIRKHRLPHENSTAAMLFEKYAGHLTTTLNDPLRRLEGDSYKDFDRVSTRIEEILNMHNSFNRLSDGVLIRKRREATARWMIAFGMSAATSYFITPERLKIVAEPISNGLKPVSDRVGEGVSGVFKGLKDWGKGFSEVKNAASAVGNGEAATMQVVVTGQVPMSNEVFGSTMVDYSFRNADQFYEKLLGNGEISSLKGRIEYFLGRDFYGIDNFDSNNRAHMEIFHQRLTEDPLAMERIESGMQAYRSMNPYNAFEVNINGVFDRDLLQHLDASGNPIKYKELANWNSLFARIGSY